MPMIILTQVEIELALTKYANEIINVAEGSTITVELKATRGTDGATAVVEITPPGAEVKEVAPAPKPEPKPKASVAPRVSKVTPETLKVDQEEREEEEEKDRDDVRQTNVKMQAEESNAKADEAEADEETGTGSESESEAEAENEPAPVAKKSIFAGLRTPNNSK